MTRPEDLEAFARSERRLNSFVGCQACGVVCRVRDLEVTCRGQRLACPACRSEHVRWVMGEGSSSVH